MLPTADLWEGYREHTDLINGAAIIKDGIVDEDKWEKAPRKVLILLKDPHEEDPNKEWNLADTIRVGDWGKNSSFKIWTISGQLAYLIQNLTCTIFPKFPEASVAQNASQAALQQSAVVNIKKTGGGSKAKDVEIFDWALNTQDLLLQQIKDIGPDIILCGGTWQYMRTILEETMQESRSIHFWKDIYFIDYYHPANRYPSLLNYYALGGIMLSSGLADKVHRRI